MISILKHQDKYTTKDENDEKIVEEFKMKKESEKLCAGKYFY